MRRFQFSDIPSPQESFNAPEEQINHLVRVLRLKEGDHIEASNGQGEVFTLQITLAIPEQVRFLVLEQKIGSEIPLRSTAFIAELKSDAMDQSISHLAEHGIQRIIPFFAERSISKFQEKDIEKKQIRRQKIASESVKKVGGLYPCKVLPAIKFKDLQQKLNEFHHNILFWEDQNHTSNSLYDIPWQEEHSFLIGPEGGFSQKEITLLCDWNCQCYSLGTRILRAPQAAAFAAGMARFLTEQSYQ